MAQRFKALRATGTLGSWLANALVFLTVNWGLALSALIAVSAASFAWARAVALNPITVVAAGTFLFALWTIIGLTYLRDRLKPRQIQTHQDYRYGLTFEGFLPTFMPVKSGMPNEGALQFGIQARNFGPGPIHYSLESVDIRIGTRASPKYTAHTIRGYMARGGGRQARPESFQASEIAEYFGKGATRGTADFAICYGPPDGPSVRRLKISLELWIVLPEVGGAALGYSDNILSEVDEPINNP